MPQACQGEKREVRGSGLLGVGRWESSSGIMPPARKALALQGDLGGLHTLNALRMVLNAIAVVMLVAVYHLGQSFGLDVGTSRKGIAGLHYDHVPAIATFRDEPACGRARFRG